MSMAMITNQPSDPVVMEKPFEQFVRDMLTQINTKLTTQELELSSIKSKVFDNEKSIKGLKTVLTQTSASVAELKNDNAELRADFDNQLAVNIELRTQVVELQSKLNLDPLEDAERCVIVSGMAVTSPTDLVQDCNSLVKSAFPDATVVACKRFNSRNDKPGLVKIALSDKAEKIAVLRGKSNIADRSLYIRSSQNHLERLNAVNSRTLLNLLPSGNNYRLTGSGRIVPRMDREQDRVQQPATTARIVATGNKRRRYKTAEGVVVEIPDTATILM